MGQEGNSQECWEINPNCQAKTITDPSLRDTLDCPAYKQRKSCWEIDWPSYLKDKPESQKGFWKGFYNVGCRECPVYERQQEQIENMIAAINKL